MSVKNKNEFLFNLFINSFGIDLNKKNLEGRPPIWYALLRNDENLITAQKLFEKGANLNLLDPETGTQRKIVMNFLNSWNFFDF